MSLEEKDFVIDGAIATAAIDSSGEIMDIEGCDISSLPKDGLLNFEHKNSENGGSFVSIIGKCIKVKKIFTESDCENGRERMYWNNIKLPFIYGIFRLFKNHPNAEAAMAIMRDQAEHREPQILRFSIEGSTIERKGNTLIHTLARNVALTQKPCNKTAISGILSDPSNPKEKDELAEILKEDIEKFASQGKEILSDVSWTYVPFSDTEDKIDLTPEINKIKKSLSVLAKAYTGAPGAQTGLDSLAVENVTFRNRVKKAILDYDKKKHGKFRDYAKIQLPEASDEFLDRFSSLADDLVIKGGALRKDEGAKTPKEIAEDVYDGRIKDAKVIDDLLSREDVALEMVSSRPNSEYSVQVAKITNSPKVMNKIIATKSSSQLASHLLVREDLPKETRDPLINSAVKLGKLNSLVINEVPIPETTQRLVISRGDEDDVNILSQAPNLHEDVIRHLSGLDSNLIDSNLVQYQDNLPDDIQEKFASEPLTSYKMVFRKNLSENAKRILFNKDDSMILEKMYQRPDLTPEEVRSGLSCHWAAVRSIAARHPNISKQDREKIIDGSTSLGKDEHGAALGLAERKDLSDEEFKSLVNRSEYLDDALSSRPNLNPQHLHLLSQSKSLDTLDRVLNHPKTDETTLRGLLSHPHPGVVTIAKEKGLAFHDPDLIHNESVNVKMGVAKLRKLRDIIQGQGKSEAHPKELPAGDWSKGRLPNGNISSDKLQQIIDLQPGVKYNISHGEWSGVQRHNKEPSKVFQLNLSTDIVNKLKAAGPEVYATFRKIHDASKRSQHPAGKAGLGWVRYTGNPKDGIFIDEVQSDLGQSFAKITSNQAKQKQQQGQQQEQIQFPEEHYQKIKDIVFQGKHPNEVLHEAFQEYFRTNKKAIGSDIHVWSPESKASISLSDEERKIPGHMQEAYGNIPKKLGMEPKKYGHLPTQNNEEHNEKATWGDVVRKFELIETTKLNILTQKLQKAIEHIYQGQKIIPGKVEIRSGPHMGEDHFLLQHDSTGGHVIKDLQGNIQKLNPKDEGKKYKIVSKPVIKPDNLSVDVDKHGLPNLAHTPQQRDLLHGVDLSKLSGHGQKTGMTYLSHGTAAWGNSAKGHAGWVKSSDVVKKAFGPSVSESLGLNQFSTAQREAAFHQIAGKAFDLGEHVPVSAAFQHPVTGEHHSIQAKVEGGQHLERGNTDQLAYMQGMYSSGKLDKLALMDQIMGNNDRNPGNYMITPGQGAGIHLIDNGLAFAKKSTIPEIPHYWGKTGRHVEGTNPQSDYGEHSWLDTPLHPSAVEWVKGLNPDVLKTEMEKAGVPKEHQAESLRRLNAVKDRVNKEPNVKKAGAYFAPWLTNERPSAKMVTGTGSFQSFRPEDFKDLDVFNEATKVPGE